MVSCGLPRRPAAALPNGGGPARHRLPPAPRDAGAARRLAEAAAPPLSPENLGQGGEGVTFGPRRGANRHRLGPALRRRHSGAGSSAQPSRRAGPSPAPPRPALPAEECGGLPETLPGAQREGGRWWSRLGLSARPARVRSAVAVR